MSEHQYINKRREGKKDRMCEAAALERVVRILLHTIKRAQKIAVIDPSTSETLVILQNGRKKKLWVVQRAETLRER